MVSLVAQRYGCSARAGEVRVRLVVIDTPPLTAVSDAFPLLRKVDGVIVVGWVGHSRRDAAERLHQVLASSAAPLLGVIANGSKSGGPGPTPGMADSTN
jgi:Mrp family chromosome partitioning ATPase